MKFGEAATKLSNTDLFLFPLPLGSGGHLSQRLVWSYDQLGPDFFSPAELDHLPISWTF